MTQPEGQTPHAPDVDQPDGGAHDGDDAGRTPSTRCQKGIGELMKDQSRAGRLGGAG